MLVALFSCVAMLVVEEEYNELCLKLLRETLVMIRESRRRKRRLGGDIVDGPRKKSFIKWDRDRARQCIEEDYLGAVPRFCNDDFKRMFRISRAIMTDFEQYCVLLILSLEIDTMLRKGCPSPLMQRY